MAEESYLTINSPFGKLGPGNAYLDVVFKDMWREAERNRSKWGCETMQNQFTIAECLGLTNPRFVQISAVPQPSATRPTVSARPPSG